MNPSRKSPVRHKVSGHTRQGKHIESYLRGRGTRSKKLKVVRSSKLGKKVSMSQAQRIGDNLGVDWNKVDLNEFRMGLEVEQEHLDITKGDIETTAKIALAHLEELPDYYTKLAEVEKGAYTSSKGV